MGYRYACTFGRDSIKSCLDKFFTLGVNGAGGFVEDDDLRPLDDAPSNG